MSKEVVIPKNLNPNDFDIGTLVPNQISITHNGQLLSDVLDSILSQMASCCGSAATACMTLLFADNENQQFFVDETTDGTWKVEWETADNLGNSAAAQADYLDGSYVANKSEWYTALVTAFNTLPEWSMTLISDVPLASTGKPLYKIEYLGTGAGSFKMSYAKPDGTEDYYGMAVDAAGNVQATRAEDGSGNTFGSYPWSVC